MSDVLEPFAYGLPTARVVDEASANTGVVANLWGLTPADEWRLRQARQHFIEANADDFEQVGKDFVDKATGKSYRIVLSDPTVSDNPTDSGVELFFQTWDRRLAYLKPTGSEGRTKSVFVGNLGGGRAS